MAKVSDIAKLFSAVASQDWQRAQGLALQIAQTAERSGHHGAAQLLRGALNPNGHAANGTGRAPAQIDQPTLLSHALTPLPATETLEQVYLQHNARKELIDVTCEWTHRSRLERRHIRRRTKLLFHGPPGCGKTLTARALAHDLSLPLYVVRFDAIVGAYLGQTALRLRELFRFAENTPAVLLIDEVDAIAKKRGNPLDVGELDRVVISLMQELEHTEPKGLVIAASNVPHHLDEALRRRFDLDLGFPRPTSVQLRSYSTSKIRAHGLRMTSRLLRATTQARSFADAERVIEAEARRVALAGL